MLERLRVPCATEDSKLAADEIERLRGIETAARAVLHAVDGTHDHTQWFKPLAALHTAVGTNHKSE